MAVRIVLAVLESQYLEPLLHYVQHSEYGDRVHITAFSRMDAFMEYMKGEETPDAVVGDPAFIEAWLVGGRIAVPWAVLNEEGGLQGKFSKSLLPGQAIAKYQALPSLLTSILQLCEATRTRTCSSTDGETLVLGIVSGSGSSGKTVIALNIVKQLGELGLSVFYLNLESVDSSALYLRSNDSCKPGLERLLYEIQANRDSETGVRSEIQDYTIRHEDLRCDAFKPVSNVKEMLQMNRRDTLDLVELLSSGRCYDVVVIDTGNIGESRTEAVMEKCGALLWVLNEDEVSKHKTGKWLTHYSTPHSGMPPGLMDKSRFVLNRSTDLSAEGWRLDNIALMGTLPYIPSWNQHFRSELCLNSPPFQQEIYQMCRRMMEPILPQIFTMESRYE